MTSKLADVAKVKALMAKGMGAKEAIKAAYPDWSDEQVAALAAKMGGGGEKTASLKDKLLPLRSKDPKVRAEAEFRRGSDMVHGGPLLGELRPGKKGKEYRARMAERVKKSKQKTAATGLEKAILGGLGVTAAGVGIHAATKGKREGLKKYYSEVAAGKHDAAIKAKAKKGLKSKGDREWLLSSEESARLGKTAKATFSPAMDKSPALKGKQSKLPDSIQAAILKKKMKKTAKLNVSDIEDEIGAYFGDKDEAKVRNLIGKARSKSFSMRHPILTGIPTLGIAPHMANEKAKGKILRQLLRGDLKMRKAHGAKQSRARANRIEAHKMNTERLKATEKSRAARQYAMAAGSIASSALAQRQREQEKKGSVKIAKKKLTLTDEERNAIFPKSMQSMHGRLDDPRSKEQMIEAIHKKRSQMKTRSGLGSAAWLAGAGATVGSIVPKNPRLSMALGAGGLASMLAGVGLRSSARGKARSLHGDKKTLLNKIVQERGEGKKKKASAAVHMVPGHEVLFTTGLSLASGTLYTHYMDKTAASPVFLANLGKRLAGWAGKASPHAAKAWGGAKKGGRAVAEGIEGGAKSMQQAAGKQFPEAAKKWAAMLERNPELAKTLGAAKANWRPLAGGAAAGGLVMAGD